jgi:SAM-dependent methyltransferase
MQEYFDYWNSPDPKEQHRLISGNVPWDIAVSTVYDNWRLICSYEVQKYLQTFKNNPRVMELGCGLGRILKYLSQFKDLSLTGYDISPNMIEGAKEILKNDNVSLRIADGNLGADGEFDFVYSFLVFQHMPTKAIVQGNLKEIYRVLNKDGLTRIQTHKGQPHDERSFGGCYGHFYPSLENFEKEFTDIGFTILEKNNGLSHEDWLWITAKK